MTPETIAEAFVTGALLLTTAVSAILFLAVGLLAHEGEVPRALLWSSRAVVLLLGAVAVTVVGWLVLHGPVAPE